MNNGISQRRRKKSNPLLIVGIAIGIFVVVFFLGVALLGGSGGGHNGYTANYGETLKVKEKNIKFDLRVVTPAESINNNKAGRMNVAVTNNDSKSLSLYVVEFALVDATKNKIIGANQLYASMNSVQSIFDNDIGPGQTASGYIYFSGTDPTTYQPYVVDQNTLSNAYYLKVSAISSAKQTGAGQYSYELEDYYIALR